VVLALVLPAPLDERSQMLTFQLSFVTDACPATRFLSAPVGLIYTYIYTYIYISIHMYVFMYVNTHIFAVGLTHYIYLQMNQYIHT